MTTDKTKVNEVARKLITLASTQRKNNNSVFNIHFEELNAILLDVIQNGGFAAEVAKTVEKTSRYNGYKVAHLSEKQAWVIATAIVEMNTQGEAQGETQGEAQTLATETNNMQEGDKVEHSKFGEGIVTAVDEDKITINFEEEGEKVMARKFTKLLKISA